jgi:DNA-binding MarR family transcriptional regulator
MLRLAIARAARRLRQQAAHDLTPSQSAVLAAIARYGPLTSSKLAEHERISRPTVTRIVAKLKDRGLVEFAPDAEDGRSYRIAVSANGSAFRELRSASKNAYLTRLLGDASATEVELLVSAARLLLHLLDEEEEA